MTRLLPLVALGFLGGACGLTPVGDGLRAAVKDAGAQAYDQGLENAEWFLCQAASIGSLRRRYGRAAETAAAYNALCEGPGDVELVTGPAE